MKSRIADSGEGFDMGIDLGLDACAAFSPPAPGLPCEREALWLQVASKYCHAVSVLMMMRAAGF